jgi:hypothetical protein
MSPRSGALEMAMPAFYIYSSRIKIIKGSLHSVAPLRRWGDRCAPRIFWKENSQSQHYTAYQHDAFSSFIQPIFNNGTTLCLPYISNMTLSSILCLCVAWRGSGLISAGPQAAHGFIAYSLLCITIVALCWDMEADNSSEWAVMTRGQPS